MYTILFSVHGM